MIAAPESSRPKRLVRRQHHTQYGGVILASPLTEMPRGDPSRTGEHRATSHLLRQDVVLVPGHEPPPPSTRVLAPGVKLALIGRDSQLDERPRRHTAQV